MRHLCHTLRNINSFAGRAGRAEFWYWTLFSLAFAFAIDLALTYVLLRTDLAGELALDRHAIDSLYSVVLIIYAIANLSLWVRRSHDFGQSGCLAVLYFLLLFLIIFGCVRGDPGENRFGPPVDPGNP
ncbi:MAG: DUF805 domain-containing protein [Deltaproteobacteria bacterium]|jgi:uncharacterized membrane protein YhaH (DUF805 family)|nr:DUF805 domain-containing protein [Deltaproteobacteria bacterium]